MGVGCSGGLMERKKGEREKGRSEVSQMGTIIREYKDINKGKRKEKKVSSTHTTNGIGKGVKQRKTKETQNVCSGDVVM